ncbi:MAG: hypothetical protein JSW11_03645 [Candidatus Heimdallarchaeota archaeon]|nr:MAG: hypothetical protein JSW11_03645 [Candidatus Heimdallarchaeota archaeon]
MSLKDHKFMMLMSQEEKAHYEKIREAHGFTSLAKLIRASLDIVQRFPELLEPTERVNGSGTQQVLEAIQRLEQKELAVEKMGEILKTQAEKINKIERLLESFALKKGMTKKEIKRAYKKDLSGEAVFEEDED